MTQSVKTEENLKWCSACNSRREIEGGHWKDCRKTRRWVCQSCAELKSPSFYGKSNALPSLQEL